MLDVNKKKKQLKHYLFLRRFSPSGVYGGCEKLLIEWFLGVNYSNTKIDLAVTKGKTDIFYERIKKENIPVNIIEFPFEHKGRPIRRFINMLLFIRRIKPDTIIFVQGGFYDFTLAEVLAAYLITKGDVYMTEHLGAPPHKSQADFILASCQA